MLGPINLQHTGELEWFLKTGGLRYLAMYLWTSIMITGNRKYDSFKFRDFAKPLHFWLAELDEWQIS